MFNIGGGEFLVIAAVALIVLGPQRLPEAARTVGKVVGEIRRISSGFQQELKGALHDAEQTAAGSSPAAADPAPSAGPPAKRGADQPPRRKAPLRAAPASKRPPARTKGA